MLKNQKRILKSYMVYYMQELFLVPRRRKNSKSSHFTLHTQRPEVCACVVRRRGGEESERNSFYALFICIECGCNKESPYFNN